MKKIFLTLAIFITFADISAKQFSDNINMKYILLLNNSNNLDISINCSHIYIANTVGCDGFTQSTIVGSNSGECGGFMNGDTIYHISSVDICNGAQRDKFLMSAFELIYGIYKLY